MAETLPFPMPNTLSDGNFVIPNLTINPSLLRAARSGLEVLLKFKGVQVVLIPAKGVQVRKPSGGHDFERADGRDPQYLALSKIGSDIVQDSTNDQGKARMRQYILTGRWDMDIEINDTFSDDIADYLVETVDRTMGWKTSAEVLAYIKVEP